MTYRTYDDVGREANPIPFIATSAPNAQSPTSRRAQRASSRAREDVVAVLEYWARVRAGVERAPRPGAEAAENKRRCAHLESHLATVLAPERREDDDESDEPRRRGRELGEEELQVLHARAGATAASAPPSGVPLSDEDVRLLRSGSLGSATATRVSYDAAYGEPYSMPFAPDGQHAYEEAPPAASYAQEQTPEEECFFEYGVHELPRHMKDWYEPPTEEYGSFVENREAAGAYDSAWRAEERRFNTVRNLKSHQLW